MTDERSVIAYEHWRRAADKVDYFVVGISAALTAYLGQHVAISRVALDAPTLELASLLLFTTSALFGLDRVKAMVGAGAADHRYLAAVEKAGQLRTLLQTHAGMGVIDEVTGETFSAASAAEKLEAHDSRAAHSKAFKEKWKTRALRSYKWRDRCLMAGVALYGVAKLWAAIHAG